MLALRKRCAGLETPIERLFHCRLSVIWSTAAYHSVARLSISVFVLDFPWKICLLLALGTCSVFPGLLPGLYLISTWGLPGIRNKARRPHSVLWWSNLYSVNTFSLSSVLLLHFFYSVFSVYIVSFSVALFGNVLLFFIFITNNIIYISWYFHVFSTFIFLSYTTA